MAEKTSFLPIIKQSTICATENKMRVIRKAYKRKDGTKVKATIYDKSKPSRTPENKRWYNPKVHTGWSKGDPATTRRRRALLAHGSNRLATARSLIALSNVSTDPTTKKLSREDGLYMLKMYKKYGNG